MFYDNFIFCRQYLYYRANLVKNVGAWKGKGQGKVSKCSMTIFDIVTNIYNSVIHPSDWSLIAPNNCKPFFSSLY